MQHPQPLRLLHEGSPLLGGELAPPLAQVFGDPGVMQLGPRGDQLLALNLTPDHEGVQGPLDVRRGRLFPLQIETKLSSAFRLIGGNYNLSCQIKILCIGPISDYSPGWRLCKESLTRGYVTHRNIDP